MFTRKLVVIVVPLLLALCVCLLLPLLGGLGFLSNVLMGLVLGGVLALVLPISGAGKRKEPFGGLLWVPTVLLALTVGYQYLSAAGIWQVPVLELLATTEPQVVLSECAFAGFMAVTCLRTRK